MRNHIGPFVVVYIVLVSAVLCFLPLMWLSASFVIDDALYYPRVAQNVVAGNGVTYDRHTYTNGFHPLWAVMLLIPALAANGDHLVMLRLAFVLSSVAVVVGVMSLYGLARRLRWCAAGAVVGLSLLFYPRVDLWLSIMGAGATMCILLLTLYLSYRYRLLTTEKISGSVLFGVLMAMIFLVRLDQVFIVIIMFIGSVYMRIRAAQPGRKLVAAVFTSGLTASLPVFPYLAANVYYFGHIVPVSGLKKHAMISSVTAVPRMVCEPFVKAAAKVGLPLWFVVILVLGFITLGVYSVYFVRRYGQGRPRILSTGVIPFFALGVIVRWLYLRIFVSYESARTPWYWVPEYVLFCIVAGYLAACIVLLLPERLRALRTSCIAGAAVTVVVAILGTLYIYVDSVRVHDVNMVAIENALWAKKHIPSDRLFAMYDSGVFSYFSQFDTIPLNGLISDRKTMLESSARSYNKIMERFDVDYLVHYLNDEQLAAIPPNGLVHKSNQKISRGTFKDRWLCIVDSRIYTPFEK